MKSLTEHERWLREQPCMASGMIGVTLHHVVGGSVVARMGVRGGRKHSDWLQIPLHPDYHQGQYGIHSKLGVDAWERTYGTQAGMIDQLCRRTGLDLWALAAAEAVNARLNRRYRPSSKTLPRRA